MNLAIIAPAYYPDESYFWRLRDSCTAHNLPLFPFGVGNPWPWDTIAHFQGALEAINNLPAVYDHVLFTDAGDAFVMGGADEIEEKFRSYNCQVLMSAEQGLYPWGLEGLWESSSKSRSSYSPWRYPNAGGWIGERHALVRLIEWTRDNGEGNEAQGKWISAYCSGRFDFKLDDRCEIFQTMSGSTGSCVEFRGHQLVNVVTGTQPVIVHFNGKLGGIEQFWEKAYG